MSSEDSVWRCVACTIKIQPTFTMMTDAVLGESIIVDPRNNVKWVSCYCERRCHLRHCGRHEQEVLQDGHECKLHQSDAEYRKFLFCFFPSFLVDLS